MHSCNDIVTVLACIWPLLTRHEYNDEGRSLDHNALLTMSSRLPLRRFKLRFVRQLQTIKTVYLYRGIEIEELLSRGNVVLISVMFAMHTLINERIKNQSPRMSINLQQVQSEVKESS